jgi:hypothetical protein
MHSKINYILKEIRSKRQDLIKEYEKMMEKYDFSFMK